MKESIVSLLASNGFSHFIFKSGHNDPRRHLKTMTRDVPDVAGMYFVFAHDTGKFPDMKHLQFNIDGKLSHLLYFGKAGGRTKNGKETTQKLHGRINNVVNKSKPRAIHWDEFMISNEINEIQVYYVPISQPQQFEDWVYSYFHTNAFPYPTLNSRRGRPRVRV